MTTVVLIVTLATVATAAYSLTVVQAPATAAVELLIAAAVLASVRYRILALVLSVAAFAVQYLDGADFSVTMLGLSLVYLAVGRDGGSRERALGVGSALLTVALALLTLTSYGAGAAGDLVALLGWPGWFIVSVGVLLGASVFVVPLLAGTLWQARRLTRRSELELHSAEAHSEALRLQAAVDEERARLAREVHDTVGHALTVVIAQSRVVQRIADRDVRGAVATAATITAVAGDALAEIRGVLAGQADDDPLTRQDMADLVASTGLHERIDARFDPDLRPVPPPAGPVARRAIQELLTNALRHGEDGAPISLRGSLDDGDLLIVVTNALPAATEDRAVQGGSGLRGLRERLTAIGGTLSAGPDAARWTSEARIPVLAAAPTAPRTRPDSMRTDGA